MALRIVRSLFLLSILCGAIAIPATHINAQVGSSGTKNQILDRNVLSRIILSGLKYLPESLVLNELVVQEGDVLNDYVIKQSLENLEGLGVFSKLNSSVRQTKTGKIWTIELEENPSPGQVIIKGYTLIHPQTYLKDIATVKGQPFSIHQVRKDIQTIEAVYSKEEFLFASVYRVDYPKKDGDDLVFYVTEGEISEIVIQGNTKTKDYVITREILLRPGMPLLKKFIKRDLARLKNLDYFESVTPDIIDAEEGNKKKLILNIEEKQTGAFNIGGGHGERSGLFLYSDISIRNLFGTGQTVKLKGQFGERGSFYNLGYQNPWMWPNRRSLGFSLWHERSESFNYYNFTNSNYDTPFYESSGFQFVFGVPFTYELGSTHTIRIEDTKREGGSSNSTQSLSRYNQRSYIGSLYYDSRDYRLNPLTGQYHIFSVEKAFKLTSFSLGYVKTDLTLSRFFKTFNKQTIATRLKIGKIWTDDEFFPQNEVYYVGGGQSVRGYEDWPNSFGFGKSSAIANIEYRYIFTDQFTAMLFVDAGWANFIRTDDSLLESKSLKDAKVGKGIGFLIFSPLGPLRLDFGWNEEDSMEMGFSFGQLF